MNWYLREVASAAELAMHLLDEDTAKGKNPRFPCPLTIPHVVLKNLEVVPLTYFSFDGDMHVGQLVVHRAIVDRVRHIFSVLQRRRFPIASMVPVAAFGWSDAQSMRLNNTSGFNYRYKEKPGKPELSEHAFGLAIDINPRHNPCLRNGVAEPRGARYQPHMPGTLTKDSEEVRLFTDEGAIWGGAWEDPFDPQHFEFHL